MQSSYALNIGQIQLTSGPPTRLWKWRDQQYLDVFDNDTQPNFFETLSGKSIIWWRSHAPLPVEGPGHASCIILRWLTGF